MSVFRQAVYRHLRELLDGKIAALQLHRDSLRESLRQETKSTAGDKYETGRAMVHIEQEKADRQFSTLMEQKAALDLLSVTPPGRIVAPGSLVHTSKGYFFLSIALGKTEVEGHTIYALSPQSPLGSLLLGSVPGATVTLNGNPYTILDIVE